MKTMKTIEKTTEWIMVGANVFALVAFIVEICQGCKEVPTVLAISWCLNTLICFLGWMKARDKYRKLKEYCDKMEK